MNGNEKALTIYQPYAFLCASGIKHYETRAWGTPYRGILGIHAGKYRPRPFSEEERFFNDLMILTNVMPKDLVYGAVIGEAYLRDCIVIDKAFIEQIEGTPEINLGDFRIGRYAWKLVNPVVYKRPIIIGGSQGLWDWRKGEGKA